jgi:hypothetical protein
VDTATILLVLYYKRWEGSEYCNGSQFILSIYDTKNDSQILQIVMSYSRYLVHIPTTMD